MCTLDSEKSQVYIQKLLHENNREQSRLWILHVIGQGNTDLKQGLTPSIPLNDKNYLFPATCLISTTRHIHTTECGKDCNM